MRATPQLAAEPRNELGADLEDETEGQQPPVVQVDVPQVDHSSPAQNRDGHR